MKRSKLFSILFIVVCMIALCVSVSASGLEETYDVSFTVEASASTVSSTDTFKVTVAVDKNAGFKYAMPVLQYDTKQLTYVGYSITESAFKAANGGNCVSVQESVSNPGNLSITIGSMSDALNTDPTIAYTATGTVVVFEFKPVKGLASDVEIKLNLEVSSGNVTHPNWFADDNATYNVCGDSATVYYFDEATHVCFGEEIIPGTPATCTTDGLSDGKKCAGCGKIYVEQTVIPATGHTEQVVAAVPATCTEPGQSEGKTCSVCNEIILAPEVVPATGHTEVTVPGTPATCTTDGRKDFIFCSVCEVTLQAADFVAATGHAWVDATCTDPKTCSNCGETDGEALGHKLVEIPAVASTCTVAGSTAGEKCSVCGVVTKEPVAQALAAHNYVTVKGKAATCTTTGLTDGEACSVCGDVKVAQKEISRLGHTIETVPGYAATCTENGKTAGEKCSVCGAELLTQTTLPATGHNFGAWTDAGDEHKKVCSTCGEAESAPHSWDDGVVSKEPTEEADGERKFTCKDCSGVKTEMIPSLGHEHSYTTSIVDPTCTEDGSIVYTCACGDVYTEAGDKAYGHSWIEATCTTVKTCSVCNAVEGEVLDHTFGEWIFMEEPTATTDGSKTRSCSMCGYSETETIPATGTEPATTAAPDTTEPDDTDEPDGDTNTILIVAIVALFVAAGAIIVLLVLKKK